ncbi:hypothetical protein CPC08DRAFT_612641, partial [Agrocybe pediades]
LRDSNLTGFRLPKDIERLIVTLFADDTTVYLSEHDSFNELQTILLTWCRASGAKFNVAKTVVIPAGSEEYRLRVCTNRQLSEDQQQIPEEIKIARDGEPVRVLGALIGNKVDQVNVWSPVIEKVNKRLSQWERGHPTPEGRRLLYHFVIVNMDVGGQTQYLTRVQGMPTDVETLIAKRITRFVWADSTAMVNIETMQAPHVQGGKSLLDIARRNRAIELMKLRTYLLPPAERPRWALVADELMGKALPKSHVQVQENVKLNVFLQNWKPQTRKGTKLSQGIRRLLREAEKSNLRLDLPSPSINLLRSLPVWHH